MKAKLPKFLLKAEEFLDKIHIPVLGISLLKMFQIYIQGIFRMKIGRTAAAISWNFIFSLFPLILFLLSILPYLPHYNTLQSYIFDVLLHNLFPGKIEADVVDYIQEHIIPNTGKISNLTIILTLIFATNGTFSLIDGFNEHEDEKHNDVKEFIIAFFVTLGFISVILLALFGIYYSEVVLKLFSPNADEISWFMDNLSKIIGFISFPLFYFILLTTFYWVGTVKLTKFKQAIPGAILTSILFVLTTYFFAIYVRNFARYNVLYGSIGSMILLMLWVNVNVYLLLFGSELNLAIRRVRMGKFISEAIDQETEDFHLNNREIEPDETHQRTITENVETKEND